VANIQLGAFGFEAVGALAGTGVGCLVLVLVPELSAWRYKPPAIGARNDASSRTEKQNEPSFSKAGCSPDTSDEQSSRPAPPSVQIFQFTRCAAAMFVGASGISHWWLPKSGCVALFPSSRRTIAMARLLLAPQHTACG
jgi:hypothetical protein